MERRMFTCALIAALAAPAVAQQPVAVPPAAVRHVPEPPRGVSGTVVTVGEESVLLRQSDGTEITVAMTQGWTVSRARKASIAEVRMGDFVGSANTDIAAGEGRANELRVFEPGYRPEYGTHSLAAPGVSMTHGFVFGIVKRDDGTELAIAYPEGCRAILVPEGLRVTLFDLLPRSAAAPGFAVAAVTRPDGDGVRRAGRLVLADN